jgi:hypothetical protein
MVSGVLLEAGESRPFIGLRFSSFGCCFRGFVVG